MTSLSRKAKDKLKSKLRFHKNRALAYGSPADNVTVGQWREILRQHGNKCVYCNKPPTKKQKRLTFDHAIPLRYGGGHTVDNLVPACLRCNLSKGSKLLQEWKVPK